MDVPKSARCCSRLSVRFALLGVALLLVVTAYVVFSRPAGTPVVQLTIVDWGTNQDGTHAVLQLSNAGPRAITYLGYGPDFPLYNLEYKHERACQFSCATVEPRRLLAGENVSFKVDLPDTSCQISLTYYLYEPLNQFYSNLPYWIGKWLPDAPEIPEYTVTAITNCEPIRVSNF